MTAQENPCLSPAWLGYKTDLTTGELFWEVCAWCKPADKVPVEREAERLCIRVSHGICPACAQRLMGEMLPGIASEQPTHKGA